MQTKVLHLNHSSIEMRARSRARDRKLDWRSFPVVRCRYKYNVEHIIRKYVDRNLS